MTDSRYLQVGYTAEPGSDPGGTRPKYKFCVDNLYALLQTERIRIERKEI